MNLSEILDERIISIGLDANTKDDVLRKMTSLLKENDYISDEIEFLRDIYLRESEGITGIGNEVAIPHGKSKVVKNIGISIAKLKNPVKWESLDEGDVKLVFLFCVNDDKDFNINHMKLLSVVASKLADDDLLKSIKNCTNSKEVIDLLV